MTKNFNAWPFRLALGGISLAVFSFFAILYLAGDDQTYDSSLSAWGVNFKFQPPASYRPFIDIHEYLAALECQRLGWDVFASDPCDALGRPHTYPVWLTPRLIRLDTSDTVWLGVALGIAFLFSVAWIANPRTARQSGIFLIAVLSPTSAYAIERANMDLLVFVSLVLAAFLFSRGGLARLTAYALTFLMATLKFYPIAAMGLALRERRSRFILVAVITSIAWCVFLYSVRHEFSEMLANLPDLPPLGSVFGGFDVFAVLQEWLHRHFPQSVGPLDVMLHGLYLTAALVAMAASVFLSRRMSRMGIVVVGAGRNLTLFLAGAFILVGCFLVGYNILYRQVFLLMLLPYAFDSWSEDNRSTFSRRFWASAITLILVLLWFECLRLNLAIRFGTQAGPAPNLTFFVREPLWWIFIVGLASLLFTWVKPRTLSHLFASPVGLGLEYR